MEPKDKTRLGVVVGPPPLPRGALIAMGLYGDGSDDDDEGDPYCLVIRFATEAEFRAALDARAVTFTAIGERAPGEDAR